MSTRSIPAVGLDIPYLFGARFDAAILNAARMEERASSPRVPG